MSNIFYKRLFYFFVTLILIFTLEIFQTMIIFNMPFYVYYIFEYITIFGLLSIGIAFRHDLAQIIYNAILLITFMVFITVNLTLDYASHDLLSIRQIAMAGEATKIIDPSYFNPLYFGIDAFIIIIFVCTIFIGKLTFKNNNRPYSFKLPLSILIINVLITIIVRNVYYNLIEEDNKNISLYSNKNATDIIKYTSSNFKRLSLKNYGEFNYVYYELLDIIDDNLGGSDKAIDEYLATKDYNENTEFTGLLKDMNVITIMVETGTSIGVNEYLTPNLYMLKNNSINFKANRNKNKTNMSELIGELGSAIENFQDVNYDINYSMPYVLKENGYVTRYFHDNTKLFYSRDKLVKKLGYDEAYFAEEFSDEHPELTFKYYNGWYPLDTDFYEVIKEKLVPTDGKKFYSFWTTLSTHGPYNWNITEQNGYWGSIKRFSNEYNRDEYETLKQAEAEGKWSNVCKGEGIIVERQVECYQCEMMVLDKAIGKMIDRLKENNLYDNTLIVLYGDHDIYYKIDLDKLLSYYIHKTDDPNNPDVYETYMAMYNPKLAQKYYDVYKTHDYDYFTSAYVIVPSILDLIGIKYNQRIYFGKSIFQNNNPCSNMFYSHELKVIMTDKILTTGLSDYNHVKEDVDNKYLDYFMLESSNVSFKIDFFTKLYTSGYLANHNVRYN